MGECAHFEVRGTYRRLKGDYLWTHNPGLSREEHRRALTYLQEAFKARRPVYLGWIGSGFVPIDAAHPCVVRSRALSLTEDPKQRTWVTSYHDAF